MFNLTVKNLWGHRRRLVGTVLAVFIGVGFLSGTLALGDTLRSDFKNLVSTVDKGVDAVVRSSTAITPGGFGGRGFKQRGLIDGSLVPRVRSVPGVLRAQPQVQGIAQLLSKQGKPIGGNGLTLASNWYEDPDLNPYHLVAGRTPKAPNEVVIDTDAASKGPFRIGDTTIVETPEPVTVHIVGLVRFGSTGSALGATFTGFTLGDAQRYLLDSPGQVSSIQIKAVPGVSQATLVGRLEGVLPKGVQAITGSTQISENIDSINSGFLDLLRTFLLIFAGIALLVGTFSIYNTFSILVAQRTRESALLRAVGASRGQVFASIVGESIVVGVVASVAGLFGGVGVALGLKGIFSAFGGTLPAGGLVIKGSTVVISLIVGLVVTVLAGVAPAVNGSRTRPMAALREVATEGASASRPRAVVGAILVALGIVIVLTAVISGGSGVLARAGLGAVLVLGGMVVFGPVVARLASGTIGQPFARLRGITATLARENAMRNPRRTSGTAAALMVGVGVVTLFTVFAASLKASANHAISTTFAGDLVVQAKGFGDNGLNPTLAARVQALPPVARTVGIGSGVALVAGTGHQLTVVDPAQLPGVFDLKVTRGSLASLGDRDMAIDTKVVDKKHWNIGTMVPLGFTDGTSALFRVGAVFKPAGPQSGYIITRGAWAQHAAQQSDFVVLVKLKPGADLIQAKSAITQFVKPYGAPTVQDRKEYVRSIGNRVNRLLALVYVMLLLAIVIALMGIGNTLSLSIYERTRELGLLRAVGETRGQVRGMVRWEAVIVALFGTVGGVLLGVFLGWSLVKAAQSSQAISRFSASPPQLILVLILGAHAGVLAGWRPARRAARLDILRAIATE